MTNVEKMLALYTEQEAELWKQAEAVIRDDCGAEDAREGEVLAEALAAYLGQDSPLEGGP
jgi:hypothetical protein